MDVVEPLPPVGDNPPNTPNQCSATEDDTSNPNSRDPTANDFSILACRICLQIQEENAASPCPMFPIFQQPDDKADGELSICDRIQNCTGIKIQKHHKLPSLICKNCLTFLNIANKFASICRNSQKYLEEYVLEIMTDDVEVDSSGFEECNHISEEQQEPTSQSKENSISVEEMQKSISGQILTKCHKEYEQLGANSKTSALEAYSKNTIPHESQNSVPENMEIDTARNVPAKILAISSDGTAVIEQKMKSHNGQNLKKSHVCEICGNAYGRRYELQAHIRRHHDVKAFECEICGQAFHSNFELSRHIRKHTGLRPYECKYCKRTFGDNSTLTKHERIHRNERPYTCKTCGKNFTYSSVLKVHQLTHTGEKPYNCELCGRRFSRSHHLRAHLETLFHSNDPKSKILIQRIKRIEGDAHIDGSLASINESV